MLIGIIVCMAPWLYRNYIVYNRPVILTVRTTVLTDKFFGKEPLFNYSIRYNSNKDTSSIMAISEVSIPIYQALLDSLKKGEKIESSEERIKNLRNLKKAFSKGHIPHAFSPLEIRLSNFNSYWRPFNFRGYFSGNGFRYIEPWSLRLNIVSILQYGLLLPFFIIGLVLLFFRRNNNGIFLVSIVFIHSFIHTFIAWGIPRYRYPIDAIIIIVAIWGIFESIKIFKKNFS